MRKEKRIDIILLIISILIALSLCIKAHAVTDEIPIPPDIQLYAWEASNEFENVEPTILLSLIYTESRGLVRDNLTQITNKKWFREGMEATGVEDIKNPYNNIVVCAYYLDKWIDKYDGNVGLALECWHSGEENAVRKHSGKNSKYAETIINRAKEWEILWTVERNKPNVQ